MGKKGIILIALAAAAVLGGTAVILFNKTEIKDRLDITKERLAQKCDEFGVWKVR